MAEENTIDNDDTLGLEEEDRLPWLESADDYEDTGSDSGKVLGMVLLGLIALAAVVGGIYWFQNRDMAGAPDGNGSIIAAEEGDYKVAPENPGGKEFEGTGDASFTASEGKPKQGQLSKGDKKTVSQSAPTAAGSVLVQLGAYSSEEQANTGWTNLANKYDYISKMPKRVVAAKVDGGTVYRLSAVAPDAASANSMCNKLKSAGGSCLVVK